MSWLKILMVVTFLEAVSWIGLIIGMIMKYGFDNEAGVSLMGRVHGMFFMAFVVTLFMTQAQEKWPIRRTIVSFLESIPPFTGFILGKTLLDDVRTRGANAASPA